MVPRTGLEPACFWRSPLKRVCLPIPPPGHFNCSTSYDNLTRNANNDIERHFVLEFLRISYIVPAVTRGFYMNLVEKYTLQNRIQFFGAFAFALITLIVLSSCGQKDPAGGTSTAPMTPGGYLGAQNGYNPVYPNGGYPNGVYPNGGAYPVNGVYPNGTFCGQRPLAYVTQVSANICRYEYQLSNPNAYSNSYSFSFSIGYNYNSNPYSGVQYSSTGIPAMPGDRIYFSSYGNCAQSWSASVNGQQYPLSNQTTVQINNAGPLLIGHYANSQSCTIQSLRLVHCEDQTGASVICQ